MSQVKGKQVKLFLVDGTPGGLTTAEITNWTGSVVAASRSDLGELLKREESEKTGVYLLLGDDPEAVGQTQCYIGEADTIADRLRSHQREKMFWNRVVVITSKDANLTKAHARYLESRLIELAQKAGRVTLENSVSPSHHKLPEADVSDMEYFINQLHIVLPVLGINAIRVRPTVEETSDSSLSPEFVLVHESRGVRARARQIDGEFVMLADSAVVPAWDGVGSAASTRRQYAGLRARHEALIADGSIKVVGNTARTTRDIVFSSPSLAGAIATGRSCNGRVEWIQAGSSITFGQWEENNS